MKTFLKIVSALIPIAFIASQYIPQTSSFWGRFESDREVLINLVSLYFLLLGLTLYLELRSTHDESFAEIKAFGHKLKNTVSATLLPDSKFYKEFLAEAHKAESLVCICYFAPYPPETTAHEDRAEYYKAIKRLIKKRSDVKFRRLVRDTPENRKWIKDLLDEFEQKPNFDLALVEDKTPQGQKMPYALSVQVIDKKKTWLVAIESHEKEGPFRDLFIDGEVVGAAMHGYFGRLWSLSNPLIESGVLTQAGKQIKNS